MSRKTQWTLRAIVNGATVEEINGEGKANKLPALRDMASRHPLGCELWVTESRAKTWGYIATMPASWYSFAVKQSYPSIERVFNRSNDHERLAILA